MKRMAIGVAMVLIFSPALYAGTVKFKVELTASGDETTGYERKEHWGTFPYFELQGSLFDWYPKETKTVEFCVPETEFEGCAIDTSRTHSDHSDWGASYGQGGPGYGIYIDKINTPGGDEGATYKLDGRCLTSTVTVRASKKQRGWYAGRHVIYTRCPIRKPWSNTQLQGPFTLDSKDQYSYVTSYTGPIGSPAAEPGTATVYANDNGYKAKIVDKDPAGAVMTSGMYDSSPGNGTNGPHFFALYDANDIQAMALEVSQGVQNLRNTMPLVAGRRTMIRFHVRSREPASNIDAQLRAFRNGVEVAGSPVMAERTIAVRPAGIQRTALDHAFLFKIPKTWTRPGYVEFQGTVNPAGIAEESATSNNSWSELVFFQPAKETINTIVPVSLHIHEDGDGDKPVRIYGPDNPTFYPLMKHVLRLHPVSEVLEFDCELGPLKPAFHGIREWNIGKSFHWDLMVARVATKRFWSGCGLTGSFWAGMVDPTLGKPANNGAAAPGGQSSVIYMSGESESQARWQMPRGQTYAHEIGHNKDLEHECLPGDEDPDYPYNSPCRISSGSPSFFSNGHDGYFMLDVYYDYWGLSEPAILGSNETGVVQFAKPVMPTMSYGSRRWISPYSYCKLLDREGIPCDRKQISEGLPKPDEPRLARLHGAVAADRDASQDVRVAAVAPIARMDGFRIDESMVRPIPTDAGAWLVVRGTFDRTQQLLDEIELMRVDQVPSANALASTQRAQGELAGMRHIAPQALPPVLVLWQYDNAVSRRVVRVDLVSQADEQGGDGDGSLHFFIRLLEAAQGARYFELTYRSQVLATVEPSATPPHVQFEFLPGTRLTADTVLRWTASDADGDPLTYSIFYSTDAGNAWRLIESDITEREYRVRDAVEEGEDPLRVFPGTTQGRFRVMAYDGFHTATDDLDTLLTVPGAPPRVAIMQPDGYAVEAGQTTYLTGQAVDREDGPIPSVEEWAIANENGEQLATKALRWTSSIDGLLGYGPEIQTRSLSRGIHRISFSATDRDGGMSVAQIQLYVGVPYEAFPNIAPSAAATASSTYCSGSGEHCYDVRHINDDDRSTALGGFTSWSNDESPAPHWVELTWSRLMKTGLVELYTTAGYELQDYDIQYWDGAGWKSVATIRGNRDVHRQHWFEKIVTDRMRILCLSGPPRQTGFARVNELVVHGTPAASGDLY